MLEQCQKFLCSISVKLFLWLWLIIISSVVITYFITLQFGNSSSIGSPTKYTRGLLKITAHKLGEKKGVNIQKEQSRFNHRSGNHLILKNLETNEVLLPNDFPWLKIKDYIIENDFVAMVSIEFPYTRLSGPRTVKLHGTDYHLFIATDNASQRLHFFMKQFPLWLRILIVICISFILCWLLAKNLSKPLIGIQNAALSFGKGELSTRLDKEALRRDELGAVAVSFNTMASQLENSITAHQRLLGDVSHELRSPLTRLQMALGLVERYQHSPTEQARHLARCEKEIDQLDNMLSDVLTLSRLEHSAVKGYFNQVSLDNLLTTIIDDYQYLANEKNVTILAPPVSNIVIKADEKLLASAISNILNNAVKYSPAHSEITVALKISNDTIDLSFSDDGTGVPEESLPKLFKAFYRVADARDRESGGTGLGLAIALQAIELHQGKIIAENNQNGGLTVHIKLPLTTH